MLTFLTCTLLSINTRHKLSTNVHLIVHLVLTLIIWSNRTRTPLEVAPHSSMASRSLTPTDARWGRNIQSIILSFFLFSTLSCALTADLNSVGKSSSERACTPVPRSALAESRDQNQLCGSEQIHAWMAGWNWSGSSCVLLPRFWNMSWYRDPLFVYCFFFFFNLSLFYAPWTINGCYLTYWRFSGSRNSL